MIKTIAIVPAFHKKGIGSRLFKEAEQGLQKIDADILVVPAWVYNGVMPMQTILSQFQYEQWFYMKQFWLDICETTTETCIKEAADECVCD